MATYGYHRTSTKDQHLDRGIHEIQEYCREHELKFANIFTEQQTGKNFDRPRYTVLVEDVLRKDDMMICHSIRKKLPVAGSVVVTELDRLGRNKRDTMEQIRKLQGMDARLMVLELYASISESELQKKEKWQREGIAMKKLRGDWEDYGRPPVIREEEFCEAYKKVTAGEISQAELKRELGLSHTTFYRYKKKYFEKYPDNVI